ncbi:MaoC family dehydratase [Solwaraspora sp. WMMB335]|uniref:MaoC family dehydratase n=1 Tax=Solwaraspora sp. WMMB335 TaxID=3404118 RepID=UPI003B95B0FB
MPFASVDDLRRAAGTSLGHGPWIEISQERIDRFADATDDRQWIHVDRDRAADGPYGTTIAHGYLTLSLLPALVAGRIGVAGARATVNYGLDRVRFPSPVPVDSRLRAAVDLLAVTEVDGGVQVLSRVTVECDGGDGKPACVAECVTRVYL